MGAGEHTHGAAVAGAGSTAAGRTLIGSIVLPAGGDWLISGIWGQAVQATMAAAECAGGYIEAVASTGDVVPNPSPGKFPTGYAGSQLGAATPVQACPLHIHNVDWSAPGKASIALYYHQDIAITVANQVVCGLIYGKSAIEKKPAKFIDQVQITKTAAAKSAIGTITLSERAEEIVGIGFHCAQDGVLVAAEELLGFGTIESDDLDVVPGEYPAAMAFSAGLGTAIGNPVYTPQALIPVSIPVIGGARVDCSFTLNTAVTNAALISCFIAYR